MFELSKIGRAITLALVLATSQTHADTGREIDVSGISPEQKQAELAKFSSINQLGELQLNLPKSVYFETNNGVPVVFTPMHNLPIANVSLQFATGDKHDYLFGKDKEGVASLTASQMTLGTTSLDEEAINEMTDELAMSLFMSANNEFFSVDLQSLLMDDTLTKSVDVMLDVLNNPRFDQQALERSLAQISIAARMNEQDPNYLAERAFNAIMDKNDPKGYDDSLDRVLNVKREDMITYKNRFLVANNAKISITAAMTEQEAKTLANRIGAALPKGEKSPAFLPVVTPTPQHYHIYNPSTQTVVLIGNVAPVHPKTRAGLQRYHDYSIGNDVLAGGDFNSRLMQKIRVQKGYTYGIGGGLDYDSQKAVYKVMFSVENTKASAAIKDTLDVIKDTLKTGIRQDEFDDIKSGDKNAYPTRFGNHAGVHQSATGVFFEDLPKDFLATRFDRLDKASLDSVKQAMNDYIRPDDFVIVTVGATKPVIAMPKKHDKKISKKTAVVR